MESVSRRTFFKHAGVAAAGGAVAAPLGLGSASAGAASAKDTPLTPSEDLRGNEDLVGFPNGRRVTDDVVTIELQAVAGVTIPLVDKSFTPDKAISAVSDGVTGAGLTLLSAFPYLGTPYSGYSVSAWGGSIVSERELPPSWDGSVVLDIGGNVGALTLRTSPTMVGYEIALIPDDACAPRTHSAVRERQSAHGLSFAAVYPHLQSGTYRVEGSAQRVIIVGGRVTDVEYDSDEAALVRPHSV